MESLGITSFIGVALRAHGRSLGALGLGRLVTSVPFDGTDLAFAEEVARRATLVVDNAQLYRMAQHATRLRDEMLGVVSHDLRNPLSAIAMCASSLAELPEGAAADRARELAQTIQTSSDWMQRMIQDLLTSGASRPDVLPWSGATRSRSCWCIRRSRLSSAWRPSAPSRSGPSSRKTFRVHADGERELQILGNLIGNAVKFV